MFPKIRRKDLYLLLGFVFVLLSFVAIVTTPAWFTVYDLSKHGTLGDALNGLTAPVIGTFGALLVYLSFKEQQEANKIQTQAFHVQRRLDFIFRSYEELKSDLEKIQNFYGVKYGQSSMLDAFMQQIFRDVEEKSQYPEMDSYIRYLNLQFFHLAGMLLNSDKTLGKEDSLLLLSKLRYLYGFYLANYYDHLMVRGWKSSLAKNFKDDIRFLYELMNKVSADIDRLIKEDVEFMRKKYGVTKD